MILVVAEKPSVGRDIARVLNCKERGEGYLKGDQYIVSWAVGHLVTLVEPDEIDDKYKKWRMADLPILPDTIPTKVIGTTRSQFSCVKKLMNDKDVSSIVCATDAGREGELIFRLIYEKAACKKPVERLWISSMTDEAIKEGFANIKPSSEYDGLYASAKNRSVADWLVGMNASRAFTLRYNVLLSIGRVQTPTLALLVKRYKEIRDFVPQEYHTVTLELDGFNAQWFDPECKDEKTSIRIKDAETAQNIVKQVKGKSITIREIKREEKKELPPQLFDLTSLQRECNKKFGFTADKTLKITQELYEKWKAVTYPRTDSRYLPHDMIGKTKTTLQRLPAAYQNDVHRIQWRENGALPISKRTFDDTKVSDHHAIIPTPQTAPVDKLPPDELKVFDLIAKRTIAAFYPAYEYDLVKAYSTCETHHFKSSGRTVRADGWRAVYDSGEKEDASLPPLSVGDEKQIKKASSKKEATKPPAPHTDASILSAMENAGRDLEDETLREQMKGSGLGTPATRAAIIERLIKVGYAARKGRALNATEKGVQLIDIVPQELASAELTGKWEKALSEIAENKGDPERFVEGIRNMTTYLVNYASTTEKAGDFKPEERKGKGAKAHTAKVLSGVRCPLCGKEVVESAKAFGCSAWKEGCHFTLWKDCLTKAGGPLLNEKLITLLLTKPSVHGSTGDIAIVNGRIQFIRKDEEIPAVSLPITYTKK